MIQDLFRCSVYGEEQVLTRPEYEAQRALALRRGKPYGVKLGPKCGVRMDNTPEPAEPSPAICATPTVKPATISATGDAIRTEAAAQNIPERPTAPGNAPTGGEKPRRRNRPRPRRKPAEQAQNAPQNATGDKRKDSEQ